MFQFNDGKTLRFNKAFLAVESEIFHQMFKESSQTGIIELEDHDFATFKLFLDCMMGFQKCTVLDALTVFPIAWKYETFNFIKKCLHILQPISLDENVCLALNLASLCGCKELVEAIVKFLSDKKQIYKVLDDKKYLHLLEPESVAILLKDLKIDSYVLKNVFHWAEKYLKKNKKNVDLKDFLKGYNIIDELTLSCFETSESLFNFMESDMGEDFFDLGDCWNYIKKVGHDHKKCNWVELKVNNEEFTTVTEFFEIHNVPFLEDYKTVVHVERNPVVFYDYPEVDAEYNSNEMSNEEENERLMINWSVKCKVMDEELQADQDIGELDIDNFIEREKSDFQFDYKQNIVTDIHLQIDYDFYHDCRILKTSMEQMLYPMKVYKDNMYFTYSIHISHLKK